jgi:DNA-binding NarL/FixJ family response regulator
MVPQSRSGFLGVISKALVLDTVPLFRIGLRHVLETDAGVRVVDDSDDPVIGRHLFDEHRPDLVVMDLHLARGDGIALIKELRQVAVGTFFLVVTHYDDIPTVQRAMRAGAHGYLLKDDSPSEIINALESLRSGVRYTSKRIARRLLDLFAAGNFNKQKGEMSRLSDREMEIFRQVGGGKSSKEIASHLGISSKTVETHKLRMKEKLGCASSTNLRHKAEIWMLQHHEIPIEKPSEKTRRLKSRQPD